MKIVSTTMTQAPIQTWDSRYPIPAGYAILPDDFDASIYQQYNGCVAVEVVDGVVASMTPDETAWSAWQAALPDPDIALAEEVRAQRDALLADTDWTQMGDSPLTDESKAEFAVYRQNLRDITSQAGFPSDISWPEIAEAVNAI